MSRKQARSLWCSILCYLSTPATTTEALLRQSYVIERKDETQFRRNRRHLRKTDETSFDTTDTQIKNLMPTSEARHDQTGEPNHPKANTEEVPRTRRSRSFDKSKPKL